MNKAYRTLSFLLLLLAFATGNRANAQHYFKPRFEVGGSAGITMSEQKFSPSVEESMLRGITAGLKVRYSEEKLFGLMAELNISQRGWKEVFDETEFEYQRQLTYIELPVMTHINFGGKKFRGFVNLGPYASYMIGEKITSNFDYTNPASVEGFPLSGRYVNQMKMEVKNKFDYGVVGGAGIEFRIKNTHSLLLEGRYCFGLGNIFPSAKKDEFSASRGSTIQVTLGYLFRIK